MTIIQCTSPCLYEKEGECTLTQITSVSNPQKESCLYFKDKLNYNLNEDSTLFKYNKQQTFNTKL